MTQKLLLVRLALRVRRPVSAHPGSGQAFWGTVTHTHSRALQTSIRSSYPDRISAAWEVIGLPFRPRGGPCEDQKFVALGREPGRPPGSLR